MTLKITFADAHRPSFIEMAVTQWLPLLDCEAANKEIIHLTVENLKLQAQIDAAAMREGEA